ncbi:outer membrane lipid asymmetry maintenance protein MlaD [Marinomonas spartinae]|uniref:outer membrane lipid asymmetry maintenance protein MlaD n=1 Tax=Marinomonas spartinae TaxID=1792290 RepID=UPI0018F15E84|nr:outer membrane lipid asymmetry maintenance protein MlaD [Marinomonas spartinae]MBJ7553306.1 outer membrane lipid asymmetry maintenance protein MlaD [Marinomonas spartinae]
MRSKRVELLVGCFIVLGIVAFVYLAIQVSGLAFTGKKDTYQVVAEFDDIGGLTDRAKVTIAGVTVGHVVSISYDKKLYMAKVTMAIDSDINNIPVDSSIAILTSGLLGEKYLGITIGADEKVLKNGSQIYDTQSALVLENLISQFLFNKTSQSDSKK